MSSFNGNASDLSKNQIYKVFELAAEGAKQDENEGEDSSEEAIRERQKKSLFKLVDVIVEYMADSNRAELDECQGAVRQTTMALMRLEAGETLSRDEMIDFEMLYDEFK